MVSTQTYNLVQPPAPPMSWGSYLDTVKQQLHTFLESGECNESRYQTLIELNPCLLPWRYGTFGGGHHGLLHGAVVAQPRLTGLGGKQADFLMICSDTASVYAVLIEIESPCKPWFTSSGQPTAKLTGAIDQLREWKMWFSRSGNSQRFCDEYRVTSDFLARRRFEQRYTLIYGRRNEIQQSSSAGMRSHHQQPDEQFISYDHLSPSEELIDAITAVVKADGYHALSVPPTVRLEPMQAVDHVAIKGKELAVGRNPLLMGERANFLKSRWNYWDSWAKNPEVRGDEVPILNEV
jgi:hypothetical protein